MMVIFQHFGRQSVSVKREGWFRLRGWGF